MDRASRSADLSAVMAALMRTQVNLDGDLRTETLARTAHLSRARFHTVFAATVGETVKQYTLRLRLERAAFRLLSETTGVAAIAFDLGFGSHEAFARAFRANFGTSPSNYRANGFIADSSRTQLRVGLQEGGGHVHLSSTQPVHLEATPIVFRRRIGPYSQVTPEAFDPLRAWARQHGLAHGSALGIAHDAPGITPEESLRFDVCLRVPRQVNGDATTAFRVLPPRWAASTWYAGPTEQLGDAIAHSYAAASKLTGFATPGLPLEEHYTTSQIADEKNIDTVRCR